MIPVRDPQVEITEFAFGAVPIGAPFTKAVGVRNTGDLTLELCMDGAPEKKCEESWRIQPDASPFSAQFDNILEEGLWAVDEGGEREFTITFRPTEEGPVNATLILVHNGDNGPTTVINLSAEGVQPRIDLSTDILDFGRVTVDQRKELDLVLTNGTQFNQSFSIDPLMQSELTFGVTDAAGVPPSGPDQPLMGEIPGNGTVTIKVWFQPREEGPAMNTLNLSYCDGCSAQVSLRGEGIKPLFELDPNLLDFGSLDEGQAATESFVVRNIGNVPLTVFNVQLEQGTTMEFVPTTTASLPAVIQPDETLTVDVTYVGTTPGDDAGNVQVVTDAWDDPNTPISETVGLVALVATSRGPDINPFPSAVNLGRSRF